MCAVLRTLQHFRECESFKPTPQDREVPDKDFLSKKVICVMGVAGACRTDELCNMKMKDIIVKEDIIIVNIPTSKNGASRKFVVIEHLWTEIIRKSTSKRPTPDMPKLLIGFRGDKPTRQNISHNTISKTPNTTAKFLGLKNPDQYTGHSSHQLQFHSRPLPAVQRTKFVTPR
ncbi:hypothetical protein Zmor_023540 [Zophobas morio]|uniref:Uncharacterized protein n=1 Tax=Zophobas morio TaxID=2755281 RepID=A0AA38M783_9CUCU|nr:hypothetical protein Zmor_023540 [Zophobas morio]